MNFYHLTTRDTWDDFIKNEGVKVYEIEAPEIQSIYPKLKNGIWLWPCMCEQLAHECAYTKQLNLHLSRESRHLVVLRCRVEVTWLLSYALEKKNPNSFVNLIHTQRMSDDEHSDVFRVQHAHDFDICLRDIPRDRVSLAYSLDMEFK